MPKTISSAVLLECADGFFSLSKGCAEAAKKSSTIYSNRMILKSAQTYKHCKSGSKIFGSKAD